MGYFANNGRNIHAVLWAIKNFTVPLWPIEFNWESLTNQSSDDLEKQYNKVLRNLGREKAILREIFTKSQNKIQDPSKLYKLVALINAEQWVLMGVKDKGDIYKGLLEKNEV